MLRRSPLFRSAMGSSSRSSYESTARENAEMRSRIYTADGKYNYLGIIGYVYDQSKYTAGPVLVIVFGLFGYHYLVNWASGKYTKRHAKLYEERYDYLRSTGKLKSEKNIINPLREVVDPDYLQVPVPHMVDEEGEEVKMICRSFLDESDDDTMANPMFQERKFHK